MQATSTSIAPGSDHDTVILDQATRKVMWHLLPVTMFLYIFNYIDRVNVSFAKLQMNADLNFSDSVYALGASMFFIGYFLCEVPSNLIMRRVGARVWIARIMVSWGLVSALMAFTKTEKAFYLLRFLLGVAEAGFFPAIILYLTYWIPAAHRARAGALFITSLAIAGVAGGPIAGALLGLHYLNIAGWQWIFLVEGVATLVVGFAVLMFLPNRSSEAGWLSDVEKHVLAAKIESEHALQSHDAGSLSFALRSRLMWSMALLYGFILFGFYALSYWTPSIIKEVSKSSNIDVGWLSAIPFAAAIAGMLWIAAYADRRNDNLKVAALSLVLGAGGMAGAAFVTSTFGTVLFLAVAAIGIYGALAPFWTIPPSYLRGDAVAVGIAVINSAGNLGAGLVGPNIIANLKERSGSYSSGLLVSAATLAIASVICAIIGARYRASVTPER